MAVLVILSAGPIALLSLGLHVAGRLLSTQPPAGARKAIELGWRP